MSQNKYLKKLSAAGITATSDGLLRDFISRGQLAAAERVIKDSILKRETEIIFLGNLKGELTEEISKVIQKSICTEEEINEINKTIS